MREHACSCRPDASHLVVLFTDGQDCCGGVEEALGALKAAMADPEQVGGGEAQPWLALQT